MSNFTFKGVDLSPFLDILEINRTIGNERKLTTEDLIETGVELQSVSYGAKTIKIKVALASRAIPATTFVDTIEYPTTSSNNLNTLREHIAILLRAKEPYRLELPDEPNRFYMALPNGDIELDGISDWYDQTTIEFFVPDGLAHTNSTREFEFTKNSDGVWETEIVNDGGEDATVNYEIKLKKESGFVGIVSEYGAMQYGKIDELDGYIDQKNVILHENKNGDFDEWVDGTVNYENSQKIINTKMGADKAYGGRLGILPAFSTSGTSGAYQYGAIKELELSETAQNWYIWARAWFETGLDGQTGAWCLSVIDENNHFIAGMAIEKNDTIGNTAQIRFLVGDGAGGSRVVDPTFSFTPSCWFPPNPYSSEGRQENKDANMFDILKDSETIGFYWYGSRFNVKEPRLKNTKAKKVQFFVGQYAGRNTTDRIVTLHSLNYFRFEKLHVDYWKDIPNRYRAGSTIKIDGANGQFFVNNQRKQEDEILGTAYFKVPPGKTKVRLLVSSFSEVESAKATIEEAYI